VPNRQRQCRPQHCDNNCKRLWQSDTTSATTQCWLPHGQSWRLTAHGTVPQVIRVVSAQTQCRQSAWQLCQQLRHSQAMLHSAPANINKYLSPSSSAQPVYYHQGKHSLALGSVNFPQDFLHSSRHSNIHAALHALTELRFYVPFDTKRVI